MPAKIGSRTPGGEPEVYRPAQLIGHPARAAMLTALLDGRALPMTVLARTAGIAPSTASEHLGRLLDGGLLTVTQQGRHRYYAIATCDVGAALEALARISPVAPVRSLRASTHSTQLRFARSCFDHLAGRMGTAVMTNLIERELLVGGDGCHRPETAVHDRLSARGRDLQYSLTSSGERWANTFGILAPTTRRSLVCYCVDWTEQRHHLAGGLGAGLLDRLVELGWLKRSSTVRRAITVTELGEDAVSGEFGIDVDALRAADRAA